MTPWCATERARRCRIITRVRPRQRDGKDQYVFLADLRDRQTPPHNHIAFRCAVRSAAHHGGGYKGLRPLSRSETEWLRGGTRKRGVWTDMFFGPSPGIHIRRPVITMVGLRQWDEIDRYVFDPTPEIDGRCGIIARVRPRQRVEIEPYDPIRVCWRAFTS